MQNNDTVQYWNKNKQDAMKRGMWKEVERINKILGFHNASPNSNRG